MWWKEQRDRRAHEQWCAAAAKADGVVSRIGRRGHLSRNEPTSSSEFHTVAVVRFRAADGVEYEIDAPDAPKQAGAQVQIAYDPALPSSARTVDRTAKSGCAVIVLAIGVILLVRGTLWP